MEATVLPLKKKKLSSSEERKIQALADRVKDLEDKVYKQSVLVARLLKLLEKKR